MYWKEWLGKAYGDTVAIFRPFVIKIIPPVLTPALLYAEFGMGGLVAWSGLAAILVCLIEAYALSFIGIYVWKLCAAVPELLQGRDAEIKRLSTPVPARLNCEITELQVTNWVEGQPSALSARVLVRLRHFGTGSASVHGFQLSIVDSGINSSPVAQAVHFDRMHDGNLAFNFPSMTFQEVGKAREAGSRWKLTFQDHENSKYESGVFTKPQAD